MPLTANTIEQIGEWCLQPEIIAGVRSKARGEFFGYDEPGTIKYMEGAEELNPRERRFLGWFCFTFRLPDGKYPAELAADSIFGGADLKSALKSIQGVRFVMAVVTMVAPGKGAYLQLENEEFEVDSRYLSQNIEKDDVLCAHILPVGRNRWVLGPGWITWPTRFGPGIRSGTLWDLIPKFESELKPNTKVVTETFPILSWKPTQTYVAQFGSEYRDFNLYVMPHETEVGY